MTYRYQLYKCPICGTVTEIVHDGVSAMICCGKTMEVLDDREPVGTKESHMPVVEAITKGGFFSSSLPNPAAICADAVR